MKIQKNALNETVAFNGPYGETILKVDYTDIMWNEVVTNILGGQMRSPYMGACCQLPVKQKRGKKSVTDIYLKHN